MRVTFNKVLVLTPLLEVNVFLIFVFFVIVFLKCLFVQDFFAGLAQPVHVCIHYSNKIALQVSCVVPQLQVVIVLVNKCFLVAFAIFLQASFVEYVQVKYNPNHQSGWQFVGMLFEATAIFKVSLANES